MKHLLLATLFFTFAFYTHAQNRSLKQTLTLAMSRTADDDMPGTRGACVTWHPLQKKYYAAMAGNYAYPLCTYDASGKRLSPDEQECMRDIRGLWYNPIKKAIQGNSYNDGGWFEYKLDAKGLIRDTEILVDGMKQPGEQCVGAFNHVSNEVLFLDNGVVYAYTKEGDVSQNTVTIHWGVRKKNRANNDAITNPETPEEYNTTTVVYTGIKGSELALLNVKSKKIELYDLKEGYLSAELSLPIEADVEKSFNFAYANGIFWLFDMENRVWIGYK